MLAPRKVPLQPLLFVNGGTPSVEGSLTWGLVFPAEIPLADRRCRFAFAAQSVPFHRKPNLSTVSPSLRPRCEETLAAASDSARVQPFKCSRQQVMLATRNVPLQPLLFRKRRKSSRRGLPHLEASIPRRDPPGRSPLSLRLRSPPRTVSPQAKPYNGFAVAPSRNEETAAAASESTTGPASHMLAAGNARAEGSSAAASAILFLYSRIPNLKPKAQTLNQKKYPPPAVSARPSPEAKPRRLTPRPPPPPPPPPRTRSFSPCPSPPPPLRKRS
jgi:hypothetical protein